MTWKGSAKANYLGPDYSPVGIWDLNENLQDSSGNGFGLSLGTGTLRWTETCPGMRSFLGDGSSRLDYATTGTALAITGDLTISVLCSRFIPASTSVRTLVSYSSSTANSTGNDLYAVQVAADGSFVVFHMSGSRVSQTFTSTFRMPVYVPCLVTVVRQSNAYTIYLNGQLGAVSSALTAPFDGSASSLKVGADETGNNWQGSIASLKINNFALNAAQVRDEYNRTLGPLFGMRL